MDIIPVLSFDPARVMIEKLPTGKKVVRKKTDKREYEQIVNAHEHVRNNPIKLMVGQVEIQLLVAPVLEWIAEESLLITEYCSGDNIEKIFRHANRTEIRVWINLFKDMLSSLRSTGFLWGDLAPRNMVFDNIARTMYIFDFERDQVLQNIPASAQQFSRYVGNYAREEFSCFLFKNEQDILFSDFLTKEQSANIAVSLLGSKRKSSLLRTMFGERNYYSTYEIQEIEDIMVGVATPLEIDGSRIFPMDFLDEITTKEGADGYVNAVQKIRNLDGKQRIEQLAAITKTLR